MSSFGTVAILLGISLSVEAQEIKLAQQRVQADQATFSSLLNGNICGDACGAEGCGAEGCQQGCGTCFNWGKCTWLSVGGGIRTSYSNKQDFNVDNARLYFNGKGHERIGFELNTDINNAQGWYGGNAQSGEMRILDAIVKFQISEGVHLWMGRLLPPSDRANLSGPFFQNNWNFPYTQFGYPNIFQGRDDGASLWGEVGGGAFKWAVGAFEGESSGGPFNDLLPVEDNTMFTGRVVLNLLDPEPGYYNSSTYYGEKEIMAIGAAVMHRADTHGPGQDYTGWNIDALFETKLDNGGVVTLEGAYYDQDDSGAFIPLPPSNGSRQGTSYFVLGSYLFAEECCIFDIPGKFQVMTRYQDYDRTAGGDGEGNYAAVGTDDTTDLQLNYIMFGHNARVSAIWSQHNGIGSGASNTFTLGAQLQF
jgi:hypothetical protein